MNYANTSSGLVTNRAHCAGRDKTQPGLLDSHPGYSGVTPAFSEALFKKLGDMHGQMEALRRHLLTPILQEGQLSQGLSNNDLAVNRDFSRGLSSNDLAAPHNYAAVTKDPKRKIGSNRQISVADSCEFSERSSFRNSTSLSARAPPSGKARKK